MSELMLRAIIGMPYELAMGGEIARRQFHSRAQSLLSDYDQLAADNKRLREALDVIASCTPDDKARDIAMGVLLTSRAALPTTANGEVTE